MIFLLDGRNKGLKKDYQKVKFDKQCCSSSVSETDIARPSHGMSLRRPGLRYQEKPNGQQIEIIHQES